MNFETGGKRTRTLFRGTKESGFVIGYVHLLHIIIIRVSFLKSPAVETRVFVCEDHDLASNGYNILGLFTTAP